MSPCQAWGHLREMCGLSAAWQKFPLSGTVAFFLSQSQVSGKRQHVEYSSVFLGSGPRLALLPRTQDLEALLETEPWFRGASLLFHAVSHCSSFLRQSHTSPNSLYSGAFTGR